MESSKKMVSYTPNSNVVCTYVCKLKLALNKQKLMCHVLKIYINY